MNEDCTYPDCEECKKEDCDLSESAFQKMMQKRKKRIAYATSCQDCPMAGMVRRGGNVRIHCALLNILIIPTVERRVCETDFAKRARELRIKFKKDES